MSSDTAHPPLIACAAPAEPSALRRRLEAVWRSSGVWALGDQGVVSLGNFVTNLLLARHWHDRPELYGVYALCLSVVMFLNTLHGALVTYPLTVNGAQCDADRLRRLIARVLALTLGLVPLLALGLVVATESVDRLSLLPWVVAALVLWQVQETFRRAMLARLRHAQALPGDAIRYLGQAAAVWALARFGLLSPAMAFAAVATTSLLATVVQWAQAKVAPDDLKGLAQDLRPAAAESWRMGRWLLLTSLVNVGLIYLTPWVLSGLRGEADLARFTAMANIVGLANPIAMSTCGLIVPAVAAACAAGGAPAGRRAASRYALQGAALIVPYFAVVVCFPEFVLRLFYGGHSPYVELGPLLRIFAVGYGGAMIGQVACAALNGLGETRGTFLATVIAAAGNAALGAPLIVMYGLKGAVWSGIAPVAAYVGLSAVLFLRAGRRGAGSTGRVGIPEVAPKGA